MKKIYFLEGMPKVGKTTIINKLRNECSNINIVDELLLNDYNNQDSFIQNDIKKINMYKDGIIVIDRGLISTLSYNETKMIIDKNFKEYPKVLKWFKKNKYIYESNNVKTIYLKSNNYQLRYSNKLDPYGSYENQKLLEKITIKNIKKYCQNYEIRNYSFDQIDEVIYEIVN